MASVYSIIALLYFGDLASWYETLLTTLGAFFLFLGLKKKTEDHLVGCVKDTNTTRRLELCIDGIPRVGCYEERRNFLRIFGVPNENHMNIPDDRTIKPGNAIDIVYNGYWGLIDANRLVKGTGTGAIHGTGDHLITFEGEGATYFVAGTLNITVLD